MQNNAGVSGLYSPANSTRQRRYAASLKVVASAGERKGTVVMEGVLKESKDVSSVVEVDNKSTVGGGVQDVYGEDSATEDQFVTPWSISVARSHHLSLSFSS